MRDENEDQLVRFEHLDFLNVSAIIELAGWSKEFSVARILPFFFSPVFSSVFFDGRGAR